MRLSATHLRASHQEAAALLDTLERVEQLRLAYDDALLDAVVPWVERARDVAARHGSARELEQVRKGIERAVCDAAAYRADELVERHAARLEGLVHRSQLLSANPSEVAAVIVDPCSPDVPAAFCARLWPVSIELAAQLSDDLRDEAPDTADWLSLPIPPDEHRVIVFTMGRIMRTTRKIPSYADA
jgi:hypothetical protein